MTAVEARLGNTAVTGALRRRMRRRTVDGSPCRRTSRRVGGRVAASAAWSPVRRLGHQVGGSVAVLVAGACVQCNFSMFLHFPRVLGHRKRFRDLFHDPYSDPVVLTVILLHSNNFHWN